MSKYFKINFNFEAWIKNLEVFAETEEEAIEILKDMRMSEIFEAGSVADYEISDIDIEPEDEENSEIEDAAKHQYFLSFDVRNSLKGSAWCEEYIVEWCGLDEKEALYYDFIPSASQINAMLKASVRYCAHIFNAYNEPGDNAVEGPVEMYFTNIALYELDDDGEILEYSDALVEQYQDVILSFEAKIKK